MEVILSTAFGVKAETQLQEDDPFTQKARKCMAPNTVLALMRKCNIIVDIYPGIFLWLTSSPYFSLTMLWHNIPIFTLSLLFVEKWNQYFWTSMH